MEDYTIGLIMEEFAMTSLRHRIGNPWPLLVSLAVLALVLVEVGRLLWASYTVNDAAKTAVRYAVTGQYDSRKYSVNCPFPCSTDEDYSAARDVVRLPSIQDVVQDKVSQLPAARTSDAGGTDSLKIVICSNRPGFTYDARSGQCRPYDDPGGPGDTVTVGVTYNYPVGSFLGVPLGVVPLQATYSGMNEAYRSAKVINISQLGSGSDTSGNSTARVSSPQGASAEQVSQDRKIVMNGSLSLQVAAIDDAVAQIAKLTLEVGGYVASSETAGDGENRSGRIQIRIPADQFDVVVIRLKTLAVKVIKETTTGEDVTEQYVDLESRLSALQAALSRTKELLSKTQNVDEALKVYDGMSRLEPQIEQITGQLKYLSNRIQFSTSTVVIWSLIVGIPVALIVLAVRQVIRRVRRRPIPSAGGAD
jgi:Flp pilus assembly protein TadG